jgi:acetyl-CoA acetyltransferase
MTVNRFCGSSMSAIHITAANIVAGMGDAYLSFGVESMSMVPQGGLNFPPHPYLHPYLYEHTDTYIAMGQTAENVAVRYQIPQSEQDQLALESHCWRLGAVSSARRWQFVVLRHLRVQHPRKAGVCATLIEAPLFRIMYIMSTKDWCKKLSGWSCVSTKSHAPVVAHRRAGPFLAQAL